VVYIDIPLAPVPLDVVAGQAKEARIESVSRHAHVFPRALSLMSAGKIDVKPLITNKFAFGDSVEAFDFRLRHAPGSVEVQVELPA
jgi:D-xylulose reductase